MVNFLVSLIEVPLVLITHHAPLIRKRPRVPARQPVAGFDPAYVTELGTRPG
jgi:hypothetical protein